MSSKQPDEKYANKHASKMAKSIREAYEEVKEIIARDVDYDALHKLIELRAIQNFARRVESEVIGENEGEEWEDGSQDYESACSAESRNELRKEQRAKLAELVKEI